MSAGGEAQQRRPGGAPLPADPPQLPGCSPAQGRPVQGQRHAHRYLPARGMENTHANRCTRCLSVYEPSVVACLMAACQTGQCSVCMPHMCATSSGSPSSLPDWHASLFKSKQVLCWRQFLNSLTRCLAAVTSPRRRYRSSRPETEHSEGTILLCILAEFWLLDADLPMPQANGAQQQMSQGPARPASAFASPASIPHRCSFFHRCECLGCA